MVLYNDRNNLRHIIKYPTSTMDTSISDVNESIVHPHKSHTQIHKYFASVWERFLTLLKECIKNWKMVREYVFIGTGAILISIFCVFNLMYK